MEGDQVFRTGSSGILASGSLLKTRALLWALMLFAFAIGSLYAAIFTAGWLHLHGEAAYLPSILVPVCACWIYTLLVHRAELHRAWELHMSLRLLPELALGFVVSGIFIAVILLPLFAFGLYNVHRGVWTQWFDDFVFDSYTSAVVEELAFRAILLRIFARLWGVRNAVLLSSALFGFAHIMHHSWLGVLGIAINGGITMALLYVITGRLWMPIGVHLSFDFIETSVLGVGSRYGFLVSEPNKTMAVWLTGGSFGPDAAIPAMILGVVINVGFWRFVFGPRPTSSAPQQQNSPAASLVT